MTSTPGRDRAGRRDLPRTPSRPGSSTTRTRQYRRAAGPGPRPPEPRSGPGRCSRYDDCSRLLRDPSLSVEEANVSDGGTARRRDVRGRRLRPARPWLPRDPQPRPARPHPHPPPRPEGVHAAPGGVARPARPGSSSTGCSTTRSPRTDGRIDVIADLAFPLPFAVISEMLGMPEGDRDELRGWSHTMVKSLEPIITPDDVPLR